jgi:PPM family protein phosphatase
MSGDIGRLFLMGLSFRAATISDVGLGRTNNEDAAYASRRLLVIADGMGGAPAGEVASEVALRAITAIDDLPDSRDTMSLLRKAVERANEQILEAVLADRARKGMGTTVTALLLQRGRLALVHVGDSRCYLLRDGSLHQLTRDDTMVQALVDEGVLTAEEARRHPQRSLVTEVLQGGPVTLTCSRLTPREGDRFLLCSDGLSDVVTHDSIAAAMLSYPKPAQCAETLVKLAVQAGAPDNVTVIVADVDAAPTGQV